MWAEPGVGDVGDCELGEAAVVGGSDEGAGLAGGVDKHHGGNLHFRGGPFHWRYGEGEPDRADDCGGGVGDRQGGGA